MKYAVPVTDGELAAHFGHCQHFAIFDVDNTGKTILKKELADSPGHQPGMLPVWLADKGVSVVIAGGMGSRAVDIFTENNIQVIIGAIQTDPEKAVLDYIAGQLATGSNVCDH